MVVRGTRCAQTIGVNNETLAGSNQNTVGDMNVGNRTRRWEGSRDITERVFEKIKGVFKLM